MINAGGVIALLLQGYLTENNPKEDITDEQSDNAYIAEAIAKSLYNAGYRKQSEGEWEKRSFIVFDSEIVGYRCSKCNTTWGTQTPYCPHCGAKMKGE